jgi:hypothetical protein
LVILLPGIFSYLYWNKLRVLGNTAASPVALHPARDQFYEELTGVAPSGSDEYVEFDISGSGLAISSKRSADLFNGGAAIPAANRSVILDFQVEDVDHERIRLQAFVPAFVLEPTNQPWGTAKHLACIFHTLAAPHPLSLSPCL